MYITYIDDIIKSLIYVVCYDFTMILHFYYLCLLHFMFIILYYYYYILSLALIISSLLFLFLYVYVKLIKCINQVNVQWCMEAI